MVKWCSGASQRITHNDWIGAIMPVTYSVPKRFFAGQFLWYSLDINGTEVALIVEVLDVRENKVEIIFMSSDRTCIWVDKGKLAEVSERPF